MKIVFFGSDDFAEEHLQSLFDSPDDVVACVTQPDRPKGRGMAVMGSPVKASAQKQGVPVLQPSSLKQDHFINGLKRLQSDIFVVIAYGRFFPREVLDIPPLGAINVHASLLPKYRGAAPIHWAIINGEKATGLSIIQINDQIDAGDILAASPVKIDENETAVTLRAKMKKEGPRLLAKTLKALAQGECRATAQDHKQATFAPKLTKAVGNIQWKKRAEEIFNLVRGLLPWPGAYTHYKGRLLKILEAQRVEGDEGDHQPGTVVSVHKAGITVATGSKKLLITKVHLQDAKPIDAYSFVVGHQLEAGYKFE